MSSLKCWNFFFFHFSLNEKALSAAGTDFRADRLWDSVIHWEKQQKNLQKVMALYDQLLKIPLQLYSHHFDKYVYTVHLYVFIQLFCHMQDVTQSQFIWSRVKLV